MFGSKFLGLSYTISPFNDTQPDDVIKTKSALGSEPINFLCLAEMNFKED